MIGLRRPVADELVVLSALCHLVSCDVAAPWQGEIYASDSSEFAGAFVSAKVPAQVAQVLLRRCQAPVA